MIDKDKEMIAQANELTTSMSPLDLIQKRCFYLIVSDVRKHYVETSEPNPTYQNMKIRMSGEALSRAGDRSNIGKIFRSLKSLRDSSFKIETKDKVLIVGIINYAEYDRKTNLYEIEVSEKIIPYLVELSHRYFTTYSLCVALSLKHVCSQRLYELCCMYKNKAGKRFFLEEDAVRRMLDLSEKYKKDSDLRKYVFDVAKKELKDLFDEGQADLWFEYEGDEATKVRRKFTRYWFTIHTKESDRIQAETIKDQQQMALYIYKALLEVIKRDKKFCRRVYDWLNQHPDRIRDIFNKIVRWQKDYAGADLAKISRFALKEDYGIS